MFSKTSFGKSWNSQATLIFLRSSTYGAYDVTFILVSTSVGSNPVRGFIVRDFWRVRSSVLGGEPGFGRVRSSTSRVRCNSKFKDFSKMFNIVGFVGSELGIFGGFGWVPGSLLVGKPGSERVQSSSKFVIFGFDPTLVSTRKS